MRRVVFAAGLVVLLGSLVPANAWKLGQPPSKLVEDTAEDVSRSELGRVFRDPERVPNSAEQTFRGSVLEPTKEYLREFDRSVIRPLTPGAVLENAIARGGKAVVDRIVDMIPATLSELERLAVRLLIFSGFAVILTWLTVRVLKALFGLPAVLLRRRRRKALAV